MNIELERLAAALNLNAATHRELRLTFGLACVNRVAHLIEDGRVTACLVLLQDHLCGTCEEERFEAGVNEAASLATAHRGSGSIDASGHAAVSATHAVANALAGRALVAASYAAYATVYAYGAYAVRDPSAFEGEFAWQVQTLKALADAVEAKRAPQITS